MIEIIFCALPSFSLADNMSAGSFIRSLRDESDTDDVQHYRYNSSLSAYCAPVPGAHQLPEI